MDDDVEILVSTQGSGASIILHSTTLSRPAKRAVEASSARRHMYNYRDNIDADDDDKEFFASPSDENDDEDLSDVEFVEKSKPKIQRRRVGT